MTSKIICVLPWILLYFSSHLLLLKANKCPGSNPLKCGNLTIPYPFRLHKNTSGLPGFEIVCKRKLRCDPGIPYIKTLSGEVQVLNISYDQIQIDSSRFYTKTCGNWFKTFEVSAEGPFRISGVNYFVAVGCNTFGEFDTFVNNELYYSGSCASWCPRSNHRRTHRELACKKKGCCQIPILGGSSKINFTTEEYDASDEIDNCNYSASAIVDKESWDSISKSKLHPHGPRYSMRLDWAIPSNDTCSSAKANSSYQCAPKFGECEDNEWGYLCKCKVGYKGDGYKNGTGCREIKTCKSFRCSQTFSIIIGVCGTLTVVVLGGGSLFWIWKLRKSKRDKEKNYQRNGGDQLEKLISSRAGVECMKLFCLEEIEKATKKFSESLILGSGGYGTVYKGTLADGLVVAVKKCKDIDSSETDQFINEVSILSQINHRNVVKLLGCCLETSVPLLVYEYIANGTLFDHLHGNKQQQQQIPWEKRLCIATETAEALSYLHSAASIPIVHRDVKSSNILLDNDYNPKVADFGVSRLVPTGQTHVTTAVRGTLGYLDPEYFQTIQLTEKSDVYSFGVVLVELLTGLKPVSYERVNGQSNLAIFFLSTLKTTGFREIIDPRLNVEEGESMESMRRVAMLAKECLSEEGERRPSMKEVVQELLRSKGGERLHTWQNNEVADEEEVVALIVAQEERSDGKMSIYGPPQESSSSSFSIQALR